MLRWVHRFRSVRPKQNLPQIYSLVTRITWTELARSNRSSRMSDALRDSDVGIGDGYQPKAFTRTSSRSRNTLDDKEEPITPMLM